MKAACIFHKWVSITLLAASFLMCALPASAQQDGRQQARTVIEVEPINFSLIRDGRVRGSISVELVMELLDNADFEEINIRQPQVKSDFLQALMQLAKARFRLEKPINPDLVSAFLQKVADRRLGDQKVVVFVKHAIITPVKKP